MVVVTDYETLTIQDNFIFRCFFLKQKCGLVMFLAASPTLEGGLCCKT